MKKLIELQQIEKLKEAWEKTRGTEAYTTYLMQMEFKYKNSWSFVGWYVPFPSSAMTYYLKTIRGVDYLYTEYKDEINRYLLNDSVKQLFN